MTTNILWGLVLISLLRLISLPPLGLQKTLCSTVSRQTGARTMLTVTKAMVTTWKARSQVLSAVKLMNITSLVMKLSTFGRVREVKE